MELMSLFAKLSLDTDDFKNGLSNAQKEASSFGEAISSGVSTALKVGTAAVTAYATAIAGTTTAMIGAVSDTARYGDEIDKNSQKIGVSASFYQEWDAVLQHSGTSMDAMTGTFKKLASAVQDGSDDQIAAFEKLGLSMEDLSTMSTEEVFEATIAGLQNMEEGTERTALASELLGKGAMELGALLNTSAEDTQAMIDTVNELGGVMSDDAVKASARFQDSLQDMQTVFSGIKRNVSAEFLPSMATVMDGITKIFSGDAGGVALVEQGITEMVGKVQEILPRITEIVTQLAPVVGEAVGMMIPAIIEMGTTILGAIGQGILDNLPAIIDSGVDVVMNLITGLVDALPQLIDGVLVLITAITEKLTEPETMNKLIQSAIQIIGALVEGLAKAQPVLLKAIIDIIVALIGAIIVNFPEIVQTGINMITQFLGGALSLIPKVLEVGKNVLSSLINGISSMVGSLSSKVTSIVNNVLTWFRNIPNNIKSIGQNIITGLWNGINDKVEWIKNKITGFSQSVLNSIKGFFGIASPSKVMKEVGGFMAEGLGIGWDDEYNDVREQIEDGLSMDLSTNIASSRQGSNMNEELELMREQNELLQQLLQKEFGIQGSDLFRSVRESAKTFEKSTGLKAFA